VKKGATPDAKSHLHGAGAGRTPSSGVPIVKPGRIVFQHVSAPQFQVPAAFTDRAGKTNLTWRILFLLQRGLQ